MFEIIEMPLAMLLVVAFVFTAIGFATAKAVHRINQADTPTPPRPRVPMPERLCDQPLTASEAHKLSSQVINRMIRKAAADGLYLVAVNTILPDGVIDKLKNQGYHTTRDLRCNHVISWGNLSSVVPQEKTTPLSN